MEYLIGWLTVFWEIWQEVGFLIRKKEISQQYEGILCDVDLLFSPAVGSWNTSGTVDYGEEDGKSYAHTSFPFPGIWRYSFIWSFILLPSPLMYFLILSLFSLPLCLLFWLFLYFMLSFRFSVFPAQPRSHHYYSSWFQISLNHFQWFLVECPCYILMSVYTLVCYFNCPTGDK